MRWVNKELDKDPAFSAKVEEALNELRVEQDLIALRERRGLSQTELGKMLGISQPAIAKMESPNKVKNLQLKTLIRVALALGGRVKIEIAGVPRGNRTRRRLP
jgi:transcriptional regulator with XRE-family HTH domain